MLRQFISTGCKTFFSQGPISRCSSKAGLENLLHKNVKNENQAIDLIKECGKETKKTIKKPMKEMTQEERNKLCDQLEQTARSTSFY